MKIRFRVFLALFITVIVFAGQSCRKDSMFQEGSVNLKFSTDTVFFDTVFTSVGSITIPFKIFNTYNNPVQISSISLSGGASSQFRMNVDGDPGDAFYDIEIPANDSLYIFVEVTVDPNMDALPFVIEDSIVFVTNGNAQDVKLLAYGQNAHFHYGQILCDTTWTDDLPHVIIGSVLVDSLCSLTITEGTNIYLHGGSYFYVLGTMNVLGTKDSIVTFQGDRLEDFYKDVPGQWEGIYYLRGSFGNTMHYAEIKNANEGISMGFSTDPDLGSFLAKRPELTITHSKIHDCQDNGIIALNSIIDATNVLVYNTGGSDAALFLGGTYDFTHCTLASYSSTYLAHQTATLGILDYFAFSLTDILQDALDAQFTNCIIYGSLPEGNEIVIDTLNGTPISFTYNFDHCLLRTDISPDSIQNTETIFNLSPVFTDIGEGDYHPAAASPAINAGIPVPGITDDLDGNDRPFNATLPDIGCYETEVE
ncbi:MAG: choice-of-anchor Q domain-containing protein [Chitinophagales bacterium]